MNHAVGSRTLPIFERENHILISVAVEIEIRKLLCSSVIEAFIRPFKKGRKERLLEVNSLE